jgi:hypothetical protein
LAFLISGIPMRFLEGHTSLDDTDAEDAGDSADSQDSDAEDTCDESCDEDDESDDDSTSLQRQWSSPEDMLAEYFREFQDAVRLFAVENLELKDIRSIGLRNYRIKYFESLEDYPHGFVSSHLTIDVLQKFYLNQGMPSFSMRYVIS